MIATLGTLTVTDPNGLSVLRQAGYGHADLFLASDAQTLVWGPLLNWVRGH